MCVLRVGRGDGREGRSLRGVCRILRLHLASSNESLRLRTSAEGAKESAMCILHVSRARSNNKKMKHDKENDNNADED